MGDLAASSEVIRKSVKFGSGMKTLVDALNASKSAGTLADSPVRARCR